MKITGDPMNYARKPTATHKAALVYGPNAVLVDDVAKALQHIWLSEAANDPFALVVLTPERLKQIPTILAEEMAGGGLFATKKLLWLKEAGDEHLKAIQSALEDSDGSVKLIVTAENLGKKSSLRAWGEKVTDAACLACYEFSAGDMARYANTIAAKYHATIARDAMPLLLDRIGGDATMLDGLIAQLRDYAGGEKPVITMQAIEELLVDRATQAMDTLTQAVADGEMKIMDRALWSLTESGTALIAVLRACQYYFYRLKLLQVAIQNGTDAKRAMQSLRPPVFFKLEPVLLRQLRIWREEKIDRALEILQELEALCKQTHTPEMPVVQRGFWRLARLAKAR